MYATAWNMGDDPEPHMVRAREIQSAEWDRMIEQVKREAAAEALIKVACELEEIAIQADAGFGYNPKIDAKGLRARAEAYRQERKEQ